MFTSPGKENEIARDEMEKALEQGAEIMLEEREPLSSKEKNSGSGEPKTERRIPNRVLVFLLILSLALLLGNFGKTKSAQVQRTRSRSSLKWRAEMKTEGRDQSDGEKQ